MGGVGMPEEPYVYALRYMMNDEYRRLPDGSAVPVRESLVRHKGTPVGFNGVRGVATSKGLYIEPGQPKWKLRNVDFLEYDPSVKGYVIPGKNKHISADKVYPLEGLPVESGEKFHDLERLGDPPLREGEEARFEGSPLKEGDLHGMEEYMEEHGAWEEPSANSLADAISRHMNLSSGELRESLNESALGDEESPLTLNANETNPELYLSFTDAPSYGYNMIGLIDPLYSILGDRDLNWDVMQGISGRKGTSAYEGFRRLWPQNHGDEGIISRLIGEDFLSSPMLASMPPADRDRFLALAKERKDEGRFLSWGDIKRGLQERDLRLAENDFEAYKKRQWEKKIAGIPSFDKLPKARQAAIRKEFDAKMEASEAAMRKGFHERGNELFSHISSYMPTPGMRERIPEDLMYDKLVESIFRVARGHARGDVEGAEKWKYPEKVKLVTALFPLSAVIGNDLAAEGKASRRRRFAPEIFTSSYKVGDVISDAAALTGKDSIVKKYYDYVRKGMRGREAFEKAFGKQNPPISDAEMKEIAGGIRRGVEPLLRQRHIVEGIMRGL